MHVEETYLKNCFLIKPHIFEDERGMFFESFNKRDFLKKTGLQVNFVQDNHSVSKRGVLRGFHFQIGLHSQAKLVRVVRGEVLDVVVDIRKDSETFGKHYKVILSEKNNFQLFIPRGFAHGFLTLSNEAVFCYKCDNYYHKESESGILYNDPFLNIDWEFPHENILLSTKDRNLKTLKELSL